MTSYDNWLLNQADEHFSGCQPKVVEVNIEPQDDGFVKENIFNCNRCNECDCEYWEDFNDYPEMQAEMDEAILWGI